MEVKAVTADEEIGTRMTRIKRVYADLIRVNPANPRNPCSILPLLTLINIPER